MNGRHGLLERCGQLCLRWAPWSPGRFKAPPILDLKTHPARVVYPSSLAEWWGVSEDTVVRWIVVGYRERGYKGPYIRLPASRRWRRGKLLREWEVRTEDVIAFEIRAGFNLRRMVGLPARGISRTRLTH